MFQYEYRPNPYAAAIPELLQHQGDIAAHAALASGQIWGGFAHDVGQTVAQLPQQIQQQRRVAQATEMGQLQLEEARGANRSRNIFEAELRNPANYNDDGSVNDAAITNRLKRQDVGAWQQWTAISAANAKNALDLRFKASEIAKNDAETQQKEQQFDQARTDYRGRLAFNALQVLNAKPDDPLHARDTALATIARAAADRSIDPQQARAMSLELARATPAQIRDVLSMAIPPEMRAKLEKEAADTAKAKTEADVNAAKAKNLATYGREQPPESQHVTFRLDGKDVAGAFVPDPSGGKYFYNGQDVTAKAQHIPAASVQINAQNALSDDALDMAAKTFASTGQMPMGARDKDTQRRIMNRAAELFPKLDPAANKADYEANRRSLDALQKQRDAIGAFESTAQKNIDTFLTTAGKIVDTGSPLANSIARAIDGKLLGSPDVAAYNAARQVAINEIAKITSNPNLSGTLSDSARHEVETFNPSSATLRQTVAVMRLLKQDMQNRTSALDDQLASIRGRIGGKASTSTAPITVGGFTVVVR